MSIEESEANPLKSFDELLAELNKEAANHKRDRDNFQNQAKVWADKRDKCNALARSKASQAAIFKEQRDEYNREVKVAKEQRDKWNNTVTDYRERGLGNSSEAKNQANCYHQQIVQNSANGQAAHERMSQLYSEADELHQQSDDAHKKFLICTKAGDIEHQNYIVVIKKIQKLRDGLPDD